MKSVARKNQSQEETRLKSHKKKLRWRKSEERRCRCVKRENLRNTAMICGSRVLEGQKVGLLKRRVRSQLARFKKKMQSVSAGSRFGINLYTAQHSRSTLRSCDAEKVRAVVTRSTFASKSIKARRSRTTFWKLRYQYSERRCVAKHFKLPHVRASYGRPDVVLMPKKGTRSTFPRQKC